MPTKSKRKQALSRQWRDAEQISDGIYRLPSQDEHGYRYGFVASDSSWQVFWSERSLSLKDLCLHYKAFMGAIELRKKLQGMSPDEQFAFLERRAQRRWEKFKQMGLLLEREEDAALDD